jgi:hypothetical protein
MEVSANRAPEAISGARTFYMQSRSRLKRGGFVNYLFEFELGETCYAPSPNSALIFVPTKFIFKSGHPHIADSFRLARVAAVNYYFQYSGTTVAFLVLSTMFQLQA